MEWVVLFAAVLVGGFIHDEGKKQRKELDEINRKLDLLLEKSATAET